MISVLNNLSLESSWYDYQYFNFKSPGRVVAEGIKECRSYSVGSCSREYVESSDFTWRIDLTSDSTKHMAVRMS